MVYSDCQIAEILQKIIAKVRHELSVAQDNDNVDEVLEKYDVTLEEESMPVGRKSKILVIGALSGKISDFQLAAKKKGIPSENLVFENDYEKLHHYNTGILRDSITYSDIIIGPMPHKMEGIGKNSSMLNEIQREPNRYPRVTVSQANSSLKITISNFNSSLTKTRYFEMIAE